MDDEKFDRVGTVLVIVGESAHTACVGNARTIKTNKLIPAINDVELIRWKRDCLVSGAIGFSLDKGTRDLGDAVNMNCLVIPGM